MTRHVYPVTPSCRFEGSSLPDRSASCARGGLGLRLRKRILIQIAAVKNPSKLEAPREGRGGGAPCPGRGGMVAVEVASLDVSPNGCPLGGNRPLPRPPASPLPHPYPDGCILRALLAVAVHPVVQQLTDSSLPRPPTLPHLTPNPYRSR